MVNSPDIATIAALIGERARASILLGLMAGRALTASELARAAGVTKQTASSHLGKLADAQLVSVEQVGRHRYFRLSDHDVAGVIESLMGLADRVGAVQVQTGPPDPALRKARMCYDHLGGELAVLVFDSLMQRGALRRADRGVTLTTRGEQLMDEMGVDVATLERGRRPLCLSCLDWSVRRPHLAGATGAALLDRFFALGWARVARGTRLVSFSAHGERSLRRRFPYGEAASARSY